MASETGATNLSVLGELEEELAASLAMTADEVAHMESLDTEQRAEIYAILEALKTDSKVHRAMVALLARQVEGKISDA